MFLRKSTCQHKEPKVVTLLRPRGNKPSDAPPMPMADGSANGHSPGGGVGGRTFQQELILLNHPDYTLRHMCTAIYNSRRLDFDYPSGDV